MVEVRVISLKSEITRRGSVQSQMDQAGVKFQFFDAIDALNSKNPVLQRFKPTAFVAITGRSHRIGEVGCYASHYLLWRECVDSDKPFLILEDDFVFTSGAVDQLPVVFKLAEQFDFLRLEPTRKKPVIEKATSNSLSVVRYLKVPQALTGYQITPSAARQLIAASNNFICPVDVMVRNQYLHKVSVHGIEPPVVRAAIDPSMPSTIGDRNKRPLILWSKLTRFGFKCVSAVFNILQNVKIFVAEKEYMLPVRLRMSRSS